MQDIQEVSSYYVYFLTLCWFFRHAGLSSDCDLTRVCFHEFMKERGLLEFRRNEILMRLKKKNQIIYKKGHCINKIRDFETNLRDIQSQKSTYIHS